MKWLRILLVDLLDKEFGSDVLYSTSTLLIRNMELIEIRGGNFVEELAPILRESKSLMLGALEEEIGDGD